MQENKILNKNMAFKQEKLNVMYNQRNKFKMNKRKFKIFRNS